MSLISDVSVLLIKWSLLFQVNFLEDGLRTEDADKGDTCTRAKGARKPQTTFKGPLLHVRYLTRPRHLSPNHPPTHFCSHSWSKSNQFRKGDDACLDVILRTSPEVVLHRQITNLPLAHYSTLPLNRSTRYTR